jgi:hypothetical protein
MKNCFLDYSFENITGLQARLTPRVVERPLGSSQLQSEETDVYFLIRDLPKIVQSMAGNWSQGDSGNCESDYRNSLAAKLLL